MDININDVSMSSVNSSKIMKSSGKKAENESTTAFEEANKSSQKETAEGYGHIQTKDSKIAKVLEEVTSYEEEQTPFEKGYEEGKELREKADDAVLGALGKAAGYAMPGLIAAATGGASVIVPAVAKAVEENKETIKEVAEKGAEATGKAAGFFTGGVIDIIEDVKDKLTDSDTVYKFGYGEMSKEEWEGIQDMQEQMHEYSKEHPVTIDFKDIAIN